MGVKFSCSHEVTDLGDVMDGNVDYRPESSERVGGLTTFHFEKL